MADWSERGAGVKEAVVDVCRGDEPRTARLSGDEIEQFATCGHLALGRVIDHRTLEALREVVDRRRAEAADLLDDALWEPGEGGVPQEPGRSVSFLFNLWLTEPTYAAVALDPRFGAWASQAIGARRVRLLEDNGLDKVAGTGGALKWHQDFSYWPLAQPNAVTIWVALDDVDEQNGVVYMANGSHALGERLPVVFGTGATYFRDRRPRSVAEITDPESLGLETIPVRLRAGEASLHHALTWHASGPNTSDRGRRASVFRYVADGTIWLGERRYDFNYSSDEVGLNVGDPLDGPYFPIVPEPDDADEGNP